MLPPPGGLKDLQTIIVENVALNFTNSLNHQSIKIYIFSLVLKLVFQILLRGESRSPLELSFDIYSILKVLSFYLVCGGGVRQVRMWRSCGGHRTTFRFFLLSPCFGGRISLGISATTSVGVCTSIRLILLSSPPT